MNPEDTSTTSGKSYIPVILVSLSMISFFIWQWSQASTASETVSTLSKQVSDFRTNTLPQYDAAASRARQVETVLTNLATDVSKLAQDNDDLAKKIVEANGIRFNAPPAAATPAPATSGSNP